MNGRKKTINTASSRNATMFCLQIKFMQGNGKLSQISQKHTAFRIKVTDRIVPCTMTIFPSVCRELVSCFRIEVTNRVAPCQKMNLPKVSEELASCIRVEWRISFVRRVVQQTQNYVCWQPIRSTTTALAVVTVICQLCPWLVECIIHVIYLWFILRWGRKGGQ
jgi:hypothetical protein